MKKMLQMMVLMVALSACVKKDAVLGENYLLAGSQYKVPITIGFNVKEGKYHGAVVNRYFGNYTVEGDKITLLPGGATMMMGPPDAMDAEREFFEVLPKIVSYKIDGKNLILITDEDEEFIFVEKM